MSDELPPLTARKASRAQALLKVMAWGEAGAGKTRFALSFPAPLVIDLERGSEWYADEFDFMIAVPTPQLRAGPLVHQVVEEILAGRYPDRQTLIIDPLTDYLDALENALIEAQRKKGVDLDTLKGPKRAQVYAAIRDGIRSRLDALLRVPMHVVLIARAKNVWGPGDDGKMAPIGRAYDAKEIVEYICDVVVHLGRGGARVAKSRICALPEHIEERFTYQTLAGSIMRPAQAPAAGPPAARQRRGAPRPEQVDDVIASWRARCNKLVESGTEGDLLDVQAELQETQGSFNKDQLSLIRAMVATAQGAIGARAAKAQAEEDYSTKQMRGEDHR